VLVVSDYGGGPGGDWEYLRNTLAGVASQTFDAGFEVVLVDATSPDERMPVDLMTIVPSMRVVRDPHRRGSDLVNLAARESSADLIALLDADCVPAPGWVVAAVEAMRARPDAAVVSGLTTYPDENFTYRVLGRCCARSSTPVGPVPPVSSPATMPSSAKTCCSRTRFRGSSLATSRCGSRPRRSVRPAANSRSNPA